MKKEPEEQIPEYPAKPCLNNSCRKPCRWCGRGQGLIKQKPKKPKAIDSI